MKLNPVFRYLSFFSLFILLLYGLGRLYFHLTAGFTIGNISSDFAYQPDWQTRALTNSENNELKMALEQPYEYLSKGCQSYVFLSQDGKYVIKFFKYQRFRLQPWLVYFPPLPAFDRYREEKKEKKWQILNFFIKSWKVAFDNLKAETGLIYVHLNKTDHLNKKLIIQDKLGIKHRLNLDQMEFCIQQRAEMLCDVLMEYKIKADDSSARLLIDNLIALIVSEYERGLADNDHALMQNTGVVQGRPIHIDVGQFIMNEEIKNPIKYHQELFTKTYKFKKWLAQNYEEMSHHLEMRLEEMIGPEYSSMRPIWWDKPGRKARLMS